MDLKVTFVAACLCALVISSTDAGIPKCCIKTREYGAVFLRNVHSWEKQDSSGPCDIDALLLFLRGRKKPFCGHPKIETKLKIIQKIKQLHQLRSKKD